MWWTMTRGLQLHPLTYLHILVMFDWIYYVFSRWCRRLMKWKHLYYSVMFVPTDFPVWRCKLVHLISRSVCAKAAGLGHEFHHSCAKVKHLSCGLIRFHWLLIFRITSFHLISYCPIFCYLSHLLWATSTSFWSCNKCGINSGYIRACHQTKKRNCCYYTWWQ